VNKCKSTFSKIAYSNSDMGITQARGANMQPHLRPAGQQQQVRVMGPNTAQVMPRAPHTTIQHRLVTVSASAASAAVTAATNRAKLTALSVSPTLSYHALVARQLKH
jgi:hypothetical protein